MWKSYLIANLVRRFHLVAAREQPRMTGVLGLRSTCGPEVRSRAGGVHPNERAHMLAGPMHGPAH